MRALRKEHQALRLRFAGLRGAAPKGKLKPAGARAAVSAKDKPKPFTEEEILLGIRQIIRDITGEATLRKSSALARGANVMEGRLVDRINKRFLNPSPSGRVLNSVGSEESIAHLAQVVFDIQFL